MAASGVGGGGFAVVRLANGTSKSFNFREMAPQAATRDMFKGNITNPYPSLAPRHEKLYGIFLLLLIQIRLRMVYRGPT